RRVRARLLPKPLVMGGSSENACGCDCGGNPAAGMATTKVLRPARCRSQAERFRGTAESGGGGAESCRRISAPQSRGPCDRRRKFLLSAFGFLLLNDEPPDVGGHGIEDSQLPRSCAP